MPTPVETKITDLMVGQLTQYAASLQDQLTACNANIASATARIDAIQTERQATRDRKQALQDEIAEVNKRIAALKV